MFVTFFTHTQKKMRWIHYHIYLHMHFKIFDFFSISVIGPTLTHSLLYVSHAHVRSQHTDIKYNVHILSQVIIICFKKYAHAYKHTVHIGLRGPLV